MATITDKGARCTTRRIRARFCVNSYLVPLGVTITQAATALGVSRKHVSAIVNGRHARYARYGVAPGGGLRNRPRVVGEHAGAIRPLGGEQKARPKVKPLVIKKVSPKGAQAHPTFRLSLETALRFISAIHGGHAGKTNRRWGQAPENESESRCRFPGLPAPASAAAPPAAARPSTRLRSAPAACLPPP